MKPDVQKTAKWTLFDLQDKLAQKGWMVPAYTLPANIENIVVMRVLCKQGSAAIWLISFSTTYVSQ